MTEKNGFDEFDEELLAITESQLRDAQSELAVADASDVKRKAKLRSCITRCMQLLMDLKYLNTHTANPEPPNNFWTLDRRCQ